MAGNPNPKRCKNLFSYYNKRNASSTESEHQEMENEDRSNMPNISIELISENVIPPFSNSEEDHQSVRVEDEEIFDINSLERDPVKRRAICNYPMNDLNNVRRAYVSMGPYQPRLDHYPNTIDGVQNRKFSEKWFKEWAWLEFVNAVEFLSITKIKLQDMRGNGWDALIKKVDAFCCDHEITTLDMSAPYKKRKRGSEGNISNEHFFRVDVLHVVIDQQLSELNSRFGESCMELLVLSASFHPRNDFQAFKAEDVCKLASKFYPSDFLEDDIVALHMECEFFLPGIKQNATFAQASSISDLCSLLVTSGKSLFYPMIHRLICLILTIPVSTATTERTFSKLKIINNKLRNKMDDEFLDDLMVIYIERSFVDCITDDDVITEFEVCGSRRVKFS